MDDDIIETYIKSSVESSKRSQTFFFVMVLVSILTFANYWNSRQGNWLDAEINKIESAIRFFPLTPQQKDSLFKEYDRDAFEASQFIKSRHITSISQLHELKADRVDARKRMSTVSVPSLGISFALNDLGMMSGFAFVLVLTLFWFSLYRESQNLARTFREASRHDKLQYSYDILSTRQFLTIPPSSERRTISYGRLIPKTFILLPPIMHGLVLSEDYKTLSLGISISSVNTYLLLITNALSIILILGLSYRCFLLSRTIDMVWREQWTTLERARVERNLHCS